MKKLNAFQIKLLMAFLMVLDHIEYIHNFIPTDVAFVFTIVSRCVAPMFAFLVVEGILHTGNLKKYCFRLFLFAGITFAGNTIINLVFDTFSKSLPLREQNLLHMNNNVLITLALGTLGIALIIWGKEKKKIVFFLLSVMCFILGFLLEWGSVIIPFMALTYFFRDRRVFKYVGYAIIEIVTILIPWGEPFWFIALPFILLYNGERGSKTIFSKYFFYIFYPVHLWVIAIINFAVMIH